MDAALHAYARTCLGHVLREVETTEEDEAAAIRTVLALNDDDRGVLGFASAYLESHGALSVGAWAWYLQLFGVKWDDGLGYFAARLPGLHEAFPPTGDARQAAIVRHCATLYGFLGANDADDDWPATDETRAAEQDGAQATLALAVLLDDMGNADVAYNVGAMSLDLFPRAPLALRRRIAAWCISLAQAAGRPHQVGVCGAVFAAAGVALSDAGALTRLEAFNEFELAIERLRLSPQPFRAIGARQLMEVVPTHEFLAPFAEPLFFLIDAADRPPAMRDPESFDDWPDRVASPRLDNPTLVKHNLKIQSIEFAIENARVALAETEGQVSASANPITMMIEHPAYRRAVPHSRSFLKELEFDRHLMVLAHEVTHVVSYLGILGAAIACLRTAHYDNEITMWSNAVPADATPEHLRSCLESGPMNPDPGWALALTRTEIGVELALKMRILQDVWEPWFEGLAVFGETSADPSLDASRINLVTEALRGLVDFFPDQDTPEDLTTQFKKFSDEFEERCSAAMRRRGGPRLDAYLRGVDDPYFAGYLSVRAVVSAWRIAFDKPLRATTAFDLLLHATRFSLHEALPPLSLPSAEFEREALRLMGRWVRSIAGLAPSAIEEFDRPFDPAERAWSYEWKDGTLVRTTPADPSNPRATVDQAVRLARWLEEAFDSLTGEDDVLRLPEDGDNRRFAAYFARRLREYRFSADWARMRAGHVDRVQELINAAGFLPIGRSDPAFLLEADGPDRMPYLAVQIRTTEKHVRTQAPSMNMLWQPLPADSASEIRAHYAKTSEPRVRITRVIDLAGLLLDRSPIHLLTFSYGDWFHVIGTTHLANSLLESNKDRAGYLRQLLKRRLQPTPVERAINEELYTPNASLQRNLRWIEASRSSTWRMDSRPVDVTAWVDLLERKTRQALDPAAWRERRARALRVMVDGAFGDDPALASQIATQGFEAMTEEFGHQRDALVGAFIATGTQRPLQPPEREALAESRRLRTGLFEELKHGWDVRPVRQERRVEC